MQKARQRVIAIVGPTAVGKSALAVELARRLNGEVISADSRQVYRGLDAGSGKITKREMRGVPHHLLSVANPRKQFSAAIYKELAEKKIREILLRGKIPIICGGTGLYLDVLSGRVRIPNVPPDPALRKRLSVKTAHELFALLATLDRARANAIDRHNPRRLIRAIEIATELGSVPPPHHSHILQNMRMIGLVLPPRKLRKRIQTRLTSRMRKMIAEVKRLHAKGLSWRRMEELGLEYRYLSRYLRGLITKAEMVQKLQTEIWRYAKRQLRWFRRNRAIRWFRPDEKRKIYAMMKREMGD